MEKFKFLMFIDDDYMINRFHEIILQQANICEDSKFFNSAIEAIEFLTEEAKKEKPRLPDYIFLDINMPKMDGWEFLDACSSNLLSSLPLTVIMLSTSLSSKDKNRALKYEIVENYLTKPIRVEALLELKQTFENKIKLEFH